MERQERFYRIDELLNNRRSVSMRDLTCELGVSRATVKRDLEYMRDRLYAPILYDRDLQGYRFDQEAEGADPPGGDDRGPLRADQPDPDQRQARNDQAEKCEKAHASRLPGTCTTNLPLHQPVPPGVGARGEKVD